MSIFVLTFNKAATAALGANTRLRLKSLKRGGTEYVALRPSYRVSGKNTMLRANIGDDKLAIAELAEELIASLALPQIKGGNHQYEFKDVGYGWFVLAEPGENPKASTPLITVSKRKAKKSDAVATTAGDDATATTTDNDSAASEPAEATVTLETTTATEAQAAADTAAATTTAEQVDVVGAEPQIEPGPVDGGPYTPDTAAGETTDAAPEAATTDEAKTEEGGKWPFPKTAAALDAKAADKPKRAPKATSKAPAKPKKSKTAEATPEATGGAAEAQG